MPIAADVIARTRRAASGPPDAWWAVFDESVPIEPATKSRKHEKDKMIRGFVFSWLIERTRRGLRSVRRLVA
jgi:hypothetical protein